MSKKKTKAEAVTGVYHFWCTRCNQGYKRLINVGFCCPKCWAEDTGRDFETVLKDTR